MDRSEQDREVSLWAERHRQAGPGHRVLHGQCWGCQETGEAKRRHLDMVLCLSLKEIEPWSDSTA